MLAAEPQDLPGHQHQFAAEHIVGGDAVFEAMHAAGILRHIAADGAGDLRGRIGRVVEAGVFDRLRDREIGHARLNHGDTVVKVDLADPVELGHAEQHAVAERQRTAGQRGPCPARNDLDAFAVAVAEHGSDLRGRFRQHDDHRKLAVGCEPVALERPHGSSDAITPSPGTIRCSAATMSAGVRARSRRLAASPLSCRRSPISCPAHYSAIHDAQAPGTSSPLTGSAHPGLNG